MISHVAWVLRGFKDMTYVGHSLVQNSCSLSFLSCSLLLFFSNKVH